MNLPLRLRESIHSRRARGAFTLIEILVSVFIITLTFSSVIYGYVQATDRAEWSAYSLAAQSFAQQGVEQARGAKWDPQGADELGVTNFTQVEILDIANSGAIVYATNYVSVSSVSTWPQLRQLKSDCVWALPYRKSNPGPFTNTAVTLRAPDQ